MKRIVNKVLREIKQNLNNRDQPLYFPAGPNETPVIFVHNTYGQRLFLDPADYFITVHYLEHYDWEEHLEEVYKDSLSNGGAYIDIGGNIGLHVLRAHRLGASSIYAFEPNPNTFDILSMNMKLNGLHTGFYNLALGKMNGTVHFNINSYSAGMARIEEEGEDLIEVPIQTLSKFAEQNKDLLNQNLALVKIDVEGHEGEVINGAIDFLKNFSNFNVIIEFGSPSSIAAVQELAEHFNFKLKAYRWKQEPVDVDMSFVTTPSKTFGCDLVLENLEKK